MLPEPTSRNLVSHANKICSNRAFARGSFTPRRATHLKLRGPAIPHVNRLFSRFDSFNLANSKFVPKCLKEITLFVCNISATYIFLDYTIFRSMKLFFQEKAV